MSGKVLYYVYPYGYHHKMPWILLIMIAFSVEIEISGNQSTYQLESSHRITCSSDLTVQSIQWLNNSDNGEILTSNTGEQQIVLEIDNITAAINNTMYTCEVTLTLQTTPIVETIHLVVSGEN